jgi:hypothetical protein
MTTDSASFSLSGQVCDGDRIARAELGPQLLVEQFLVVRDQGVGRLEDAYRRAVVLFELDHLEVRVVARQAAQIGDIGTAPAIDRLIVIADRGERGAWPGQQPQQLVLAGIGILVFVDQQIAQAVLPFLADCRMASRRAPRAERSGRRNRPPGTRRVAA